MAAHTSQSVAKAAGNDDGAKSDDIAARGRSRRTDSGNRGGFKRALATHWYAWTMITPVVLVLGVIIGWPSSAASTCR